MGISCLEVKLLAMWERSRRERVAARYTLMAWNNHILSLHSRLTASINFDDACNLPCFKLRDREHLLELCTVSHCSAKQLRSLALFSFLPDMKQKGDDLDLTSTYIPAAGHRAPLKQQARRVGSDSDLKKGVRRPQQPVECWSVTQAAPFQLKHRFLSQMYPDQDWKPHP